MYYDDTSLNRLLRISKRIRGPLVLSDESGEDLVVLPLDVFDRLITDQEDGVLSWQKEDMNEERGEPWNQEEDAEVAMPSFESKIPSFSDTQTESDWNFSEPESHMPVKGNDSFEPAEFEGWEEEPLVEEPVFYEEQL
ncbi:MAG: hypothetical protein AAB932_03310 [Patescibacteria group bacterium]